MNTFYKISSLGVLLSISNMASAETVEVAALSLLNNYNLITSGNVASTSEVEGNALIGGDVTGGLYNMHVTSNADVPSLTVAGELNGNVQTKGKGVNIGGDVAGSLTVNDGGDVFVQSVSGFVQNNANGDGSTSVVGNISGTVNTNGGNTLFGGSNTGTAQANGGGSVLNQSVSVPFDPTSAVNNAINTLSAFSSNLASLDANSSYSISGGKVTFNATADSNGLAVFSIKNAQSFFNTSYEFDFNIGSANSILFNLSDDTFSDYVLNANFLANSAPSLADMFLWNFIDAETLTVNAQFGGSMLALNADVTTYQNIEGTLVAKTLNQNGEIHSQPSTFVPPTVVPVPTAAFLFAPAMIGLMALRRRSKKHA